MILVTFYAKQRQRPAHQKAIDVGLFDQLCLGEWGAYMEYYRDLMGIPWISNRDITSDILFLGGGCLNMSAHGVYGYTPEVVTLVGT